MDIFMGYLMGLCVGLLIAVANHESVTQFQIDQAQAACVENKGLREIDGNEFRCANGAVFTKESK